MAAAVPDVCVSTARTHGRHHSLLHMTVSPPGQQMTHPPQGITCYHLSVAPEERTLPRRTDTPQEMDPIGEVRGGGMAASQHVTGTFAIEEIRDRARTLERTPRRRRPSRF